MQVIEFLPGTVTVGIMAVTTNVHIVKPRLTLHFCQVYTYYHLLITQSMYSHSSEMNDTVQRDIVVITSFLPEHDP